MKLGNWTFVFLVGALIALVLLGISLFATKDKAQAPEEVALTRGTIVIDFKGSPATRAPATATFGVQQSQPAWDVVRQTIGENNLTYDDFGGNLGVFITGFYGVKAEGNHFWEFSVNGKASEVGVSSYMVKDGDKLEFRYASY